MKIIHVIVGLGDGGAEKSLFKLVSADSQNSHIVVSLTTEGKYGPLLRHGGNTVVCIQWTLLTMVGSLTRLASMIRREKPDIVHAWMPHACLVASVAARLVGHSRIFWSIRASDYGKGIKTLQTRLIVRLLGVASSTVPRRILVVGARAMKKHVALGFSQRKMVLVPNGYQVEEELGFTSGLKGPREGKRPGDTFTIGMVARFHPQKDHLTLLTALSLLADVDSNFLCLLAGEGVDYDNAELVAALSDFGLSQKVELLGSLADPQVFYSKLDAHILSSSYGEGFPNVVAESMLVAVPNIVTDVGDAAEIVADTGWVVKPGSAAGLASGIRAAMNMTFEERLERGRQARSRIVNNYSLDKMVSGHLREYVSLDIAVFPRYASLGASSRVRMYQFFPVLRREGWSVTAYPFSSDRYIEQLYLGRNRLLEVLRSYLRRIWELHGARSADVVWVEKEFLPWLPFSIERLLVPVFRRIIYDFDDAVHEQHREHPNVLIRVLLRRKIEKSVSTANGVIAGNAFLAEYLAPRSGGPTVVIPSVVNSNEIFPLSRSSPQGGKPFTFGWIGTPITWSAYVEKLHPLFESLAEELEAQFLVVGAGDAGLSGTYVKFVPWTLAQENSLLNSFDVGIMPLGDDPWSRGKCGFKLLQCMSAGVPVVASAVGVNRKIVNHGVDGYLVEHEKDWEKYLRTLATDPGLLVAMSDKARTKVREKYSLEFAVPLLVDFFRQTTDH